MLMKVDSLRRIPLLSDFSYSELESLAVIFSEEIFAPSSILIHEGELGDRFFFILEGEIEIIQGHGTAEEHLIATVGPGDFLGEMSLVDPSSLRSASARALKTTESAHITQENFLILLEEKPRLALRLLQETVRRIRRSQSAMIQDLNAKNLALSAAYHDLQQAQSALIEKEKLEHELGIAREIQRSILPKHVPEIAGWEVTSHWQPARSVSGDFYDFLPFPDGRLGMLIADVSGKGIPAALVMATTCSVIRAVASSRDSPGELLGQVNKILFQNIPQGMFVTCLYGILDTSRGEFRFANAGHNLPKIISQNGVSEIRATGMPLGLLPGSQYEESEAVLHPGEGMILFTDGMVEAHNERSEMFGLARLEDLLAKQTTGSNIIANLLDCLAQFTGPDREQEDDITFVILTKSMSQ